MSMHLDDRDRQGKALEQWEKQQAQWKNVQTRLARKVGKPVEETLPGVIHHFRMHSEELGMIDASVPAEVKNGVSAWEMNLRGHGGVRYVQVGSSYPYPLYCPIRDAETAKPDSNTLMRVVPEQPPPPRHKPVAEGEYFRLRQQEFKKHIRRKFAHFAPDPAPLSVVGVRPPRADTQLKDDNSVEPIVFVPYVASDFPPSTLQQQKAPPHGAGANNALGLADAAPPSRPLSALLRTVGGGDGVTAAVAATTGAQPHQQPQHDGPMLLFSTAHLTFTAVPNQAAQATLRVDNIGSTAVYYSWSPFEVDSVVKDRRGAECFSLSAPPNGVFLPEDEAYFTFGFRSAVPGVFAQQFELLTVPAGKERIVVQLRGAVLGAGGDVLSTSRLDKALCDKAAREDCEGIVTGVVSAHRDNALDAAFAAMEEREAVAASRHTLDEQRVRREHRAARWAEHNAVLGAAFNEHVYEAFVVMHRNMHRFLRGVGSAAAVLSAAAAAGGAGSPLAASPAGGGGGGGGGSLSASPVPGARPVTSSTPVPGQQAAATAAAAVAASATPVPTAPSLAVAGVAAAPAAGAPAALPPLLAADLAPCASEPEWGGSVRAFLEEVTALRDTQVRVALLGSVNVLLRAAAAAGRDSPLSSSTSSHSGDASAADASLESLLMRAAGLQAFRDAVDDIAGCAVAARDVVEGRGIGGARAAAGGKAGDGKGGDKGKAGGAAKKPAPPAAAASVAGGKGGAGASPTGADGAPLRTAETDAKQEEYESLMFAFSRRVVGDAVQNMLTLGENARYALENTCRRPLGVLVSRRFDAIVAQAAEIEPDVEATVEVNPKGKKK